MASGGRPEATGDDRHGTDPAAALPRVLLPVRVLEGEAASPGLIELLARAEVVLLGYHVIPEQTAPAQARLSFEDRAAPKLDDIEESLVEAGANVDRLLVFTHDEEQTIERVAAEEDCEAVAYVNPVNDCERVLLVLHGDVDAEHIASLTAGLIADRSIDVGLLEVIESAEETELVERALSVLLSEGIGRSRIHEMSLATDAIVRDIALVADDFDVTVLGEREPTLEDILFGEFDERVVAESLGPVLVVRREGDEEEEEE